MAVGVTSLAPHGAKARQAVAGRARRLRAGEVVARAVAARRIVRRRLTG